MKTPPFPARLILTAAAIPLLAMNTGCQCKSQPTGGDTGSHKEVMLNGGGTHPHAGSGHPSGGGTHPPRPPRDNK